ncbi:MAG TPA: hypothetical protein DEP53_15575 [Bacteroidetes bacterium]|nr:MAG: hypothetical protein A2X66_04065 [Ignavibacteria bacterium GWA2_54_16]HCA81150.1 hypothetical protein [Bacteroidota bacterium]
MGISQWRSAFSILALTILFLMTAVAAQPNGSKGRSVESQASTPQKTDTLRLMHPSTFDDMARRVDSLQFIVVYNADLLQKDVGTKVMWIYIMLGVMILASGTMYIALRQAQRSREDLEGKLTAQLASVVNHLEAEIKSLSDKMDFHHPSPGRRPSKKKS